MTTTRKWIRTTDGKILVRPGIGVATSLECCCGGCCEDTLIWTTIDPITFLPIPGTVLLATILSDTTGCFTVGNSIELDDSVSPGIWSSNGVHLDDPGTTWKTLELACDTSTTPNRLVLYWGLGQCPEVDTGPQLPGPWDWTRLSGVCDPLQFDYSYTLAEVAPPSTCPCLTGTVTIRITIKP